MKKITFGLIAILSLDLGTKRHRIKQLLLFLFLILHFFSFGQEVLESIHFDNYNSANDNDFVNNFSDQSGFVQIATNGITGGALKTPNLSKYFGARYCSKYKNEINALTGTLISFKYNGTLINPNERTETVGIMLNGSLSFQYIRVNILDKKLNITNTGNGSYEVSPVILNLVDNHWYALFLETSIYGGNFGDEIYVYSDIYDLGLEGTDNAKPLFMSAVSKHIYDITFVEDQSVDVEIFGGKWGGAEYLDDFVFNGVKSDKSCTNLNTYLNVENRKEIRIYPNPSNEIIHFGNKSVEEVTIVDLLGNIVLRKKGNYSELNIEELSKGVYIIKIKSDRKNYIEKLIKS